MKKKELIAVLIAFVLTAAACGAPYARRHAVKGGETVAGLARTYGLTEAELREFNHLQAGDRLRPGDVIFIPGDRQPRPVPAPNRSLPSVAPVKVTPPVPPSSTPPPVRNGASNWNWPVVGEVLVGFGPGPAGNNRGIDIAAEAGAEVRAVATGAVTYAGTPAPAYGAIVILDHTGGVFSVYSHLSSAELNKGEAVTRGGVVGRAGPASNGKPAHIHFEVRKDEKPVDPLLYLPPR